MNKLENGESENVVMFPASRRAPVLNEPVIDDPLDELLNEFSYLTDEPEITDPEVLAELEEMRHEEAVAQAKAREAQTPTQRLQESLSDMGQLELYNHINDKLSVLQEARARMKHMLNEIEFYLPKNK